MYIINFGSIFVFSNLHRASNLNLALSQKEEIYILNRFTVNKTVLVIIIIYII